MSRQLSDDPDKRRLQIFRRIYSNYHRWRVEVEESHLLFLTVDGEEIFFYDLMVGLDELPARQRQAFELHILLGTPERQAAWDMGFLRHVDKPVFDEDGEPLLNDVGEQVIEVETVGWVTLVGQYSTNALKRMVASYDAVDRGTISPPEYEVGAC